MQRFLKPAIIAFLLGSSGMAQADWQSGETDRSAWAMASGKGGALRLSCNKGDGFLHFLLTGGPFLGMQNIDDGRDTLMMWIGLPGGRTAKHPIDGHYFAPDKAFVGRFLVSDTVLEQFRQGNALSLTAARGGDIAMFDMKGTGKARGHFKQACGL